MIIIRADEAASMPATQHKAQAQYYGQGTELSQAGAQISGTANKALAQASYLAEQQAREKAKNTMLQESANWEKDLDERTNDALNGWDRQYVQNGKHPSESMDAYGNMLGEIRDSFLERHRKDLGSNAYLDQAFEAHWAQFEAKHTAQARAYANKGFLDASRKQFEGAIEDHKRILLKTEATEGPEAYRAGLTTINAMIDSGSQGIMAPPEREQFRRGVIQDLEQKRAYQTVARNPEQFISDYHLNQFPDLDPKLAKDLLSTAEVSLARKVEMEEKTRTDRTLQLTQARTDMKNDLLERAYKGDIAGAMTEAMKPYNKVILDTDFDSTMATLRTLSKEGPSKDDPTTYAELKREIDHNPTEGTYKKVEMAFNNGQLKTETFASFSTRITERREHLRDKAKQERHQATNDAISTYKPLLETVSKLSFDKFGADAQAMWEDELRSNLEKNPKLNPMDEGRRLSLKYRTLIEDRNEAAGEAMIREYGFKSPEDVLTAWRQKRITQLQSDLLIEYMKKGGIEKPAAPASSSSNLLKKK